MAQIAKAKIRKAIVRRQNLLLHIGIGLLAAGISFKVFFPYLLHEIVRSSLEFVPGSEVFNNWKINKEPYNYDIYMYNWTNADDVHNASIKPNFTQIGPYRYRLQIEKRNITIHDNNTATYNLVKKYIFVQEEGTRPLSDLITTINPVPNIIAYKMRNTNFIAKLTLSLALRSINAKVHITKTAREWLFEGYHDPILDVVSKIPVGPKMMKKFGFYYQKNYTDSVTGPININTTVDDTYGQLNSFKGGNRTDFFPGSCGVVKGSMGEFSEMSRDIKKPLILYVPEVNSYLPLYYERQQDVKGIASDVYTPKITMFDNGTIDPANECFCNGECVPNGLRNMSSSYMDAPMFFSLPHFYMSDPYYTDAIDGVKPNPETDGVFAMYEPFSGVVTAVALKIQLNILLQPISGMGLYSNVPKYFIPVFYVNQTVLLDDKSIQQLSMIQIAPKINTYLCCLLMILGIIMAISALIGKRAYRKEVTFKDDKRIYAEEEPLNKKLHT